MRLSVRKKPGAPPASQGRPRATRWSRRRVAEGRGGESWLGVLPAPESGGPPLRPPLGPSRVGANQQAPPARPAPSPSGDRKSAQQMRKWQAGWPWGLLSGPAPSEPFTAARLAPHW